MSFEWVEYEVQTRDYWSTPLERAQPENTFFHIMDTLGFRNGLDVPWQAVWNDARNQPLRTPPTQPPRTDQSLRPGDKLWLRRRIPDPSWQLEEYTVTGSETSLDEICKTIQERHRRADSSSTLAGPSLEPRHLYHLFENADFRARHKQHLMPFTPATPLRFYQLEPGSKLRYFVKPKSAVPVPVATQPPFQLDPEPPGRAPFNNSIVIPGLSVPRVELHRAPGQGHSVLDPVLVPLAMHGAGGVGSRLRESRVEFEVTLAEKVHATTLQVLRDNGTLLYSERHEAGPFIEAGTHRFGWDGFSASGNAGVLDTKVLRGQLVVTAAVEHRPGAYPRKGSLHLSNAAGLASYADVQIDIGARKIHFFLYLHIAQMADLQSDILSLLKDLSPTSGWATDHLRDKIRLHPSTFDAARDFIKEGVAFHWARKVTGTALAPAHSRGTVTIEGNAYTLSAEVRERSRDAVELRLMATLFPRQRPCNAGAVVNGGPIIIPWDGNVVYNQKAAAHELGHSVLRDIRDKHWSITHKGSSDQLQRSLPNRCYPAAPGPIDLMQYYSGCAAPECNDGYQPADYHQRAILTEEDVLSLVSICHVGFHQKF